MLFAPALDLVNRDIYVGSFGQNTISYSILRLPMDVPEGAMGCLAPAAFGCRYRGYGEEIMVGN